MQSVQRHFGKYMKRTADEKTVSVLLKDFEEADQLLSKIIDASKAWKESWIAILTYQHRLFSEFEGMYTPIIGAGPEYQGHIPVDTPEATMSRTVRLKSEYEDLKTDLTEEVNQVDVKMIHPAQDAKDSLQLLKKTIKKREDKKLDFERYQSRHDALMKKTKRTDREDAAILKVKDDLFLATEVYSAADDNLRATLPRLLTTVFSLLPHLLAAQIQIQNTLLAHYYTQIVGYCTEESFPNPSPPMDEVIRFWEDAFKPTQREIESIAILAMGKAVRASMHLEPNGHGHSNGHGLRRPSTQSYSRGASVSPARALPLPELRRQTLALLPIPKPQHNLSPRPNLLGTTRANPALLLDNTHPRPTKLLPRRANSRLLQPRPPALIQYTPNIHHNHHSTYRPVHTLFLGADPIEKEAPPPPPRIPSQQHVFVTALYDFDGQGDGDLMFKEGDRIRIVKKTDSTDDWWQGELRGVKGAFPANYCQ